MYRISFPKGGIPKLLILLMKNRFSWQDQKEKEINFASSITQPITNTKSPP